MSSASCCNKLEIVSSGKAKTWNADVLGVYEVAYSSSEYPSYKLLDKTIHLRFVANKFWQVNKEHKY